MTLYQGGGKRVFDLLIGGLLLVLTLPIQAVIAVLVRRRLGSPVLFVQQRPGRDGRPFRLRKFRTMTDARDANGDLLPQDERLTPFGQRLRASSLDELPELFSVVTGDMSLVGPRPLLTEYLPRYSPRQTRRHAVRPGLTGWAQIHGRNATTWAQRLALDVWYVENLSLRLDVTILLRTVSAVLRRDGISHPEHTTMPSFTGAEGD